MPIDAEVYLSLLERDIEVVANLAESVTEWTTRVPDCPEWTLYDLVGHFGVVHRMATEAVESRAEPSRDIAPPGPAELAEWVRDGGAELLRVLNRDPREQAWSFAPGRETVGFWQRRMALEDAVHRRDVEAAMGEAGSIATVLAADGIDEVVHGTIDLGKLRGRLELPDTHALILHTTDTSEHWQIGDGPRVASLGGPAEHIYLALWKRTVEDDQCRLIGDEAAGRSILGLALTP